MASCAYEIVMFFSMTLMLISTLYLFSVKPNKSDENSKVSAATFDGLRSEILSDASECSSNPCLNGAQCVEGPRGYQCECTLGFKGRDCSSCDGLLYEGNECYHAVSRDYYGNYTKAEETCANMAPGGHLAYIKDEKTFIAVQEYLRSIPGLVGYDLAWIGASYDPIKGSNVITWGDGDVTDIESWWHPGFPHTGTRYKSYNKMKLDVSDKEDLGFQGMVNWPASLPNYPLCQFTMPSSP